MVSEFEKRGREYVAMLDYIFPEIYQHNPFSGYLLTLVIASLQEKDDDSCTRVEHSSCADCSMQVRHD